LKNHSKEGHSPHHLNAQEWKTIDYAGRSIIAA
jgi:hypothetical protein